MDLAQLQLGLLVICLYPTLLISLASRLTAKCPLSIPSYHFLMSLLPTEWKPPILDLEAMKMNKKFTIPVVYQCFW